MRIWIAIVVLMFAVVSHASKASESSVYVSAAKLLDLCESDSVTDQGICVGYLMGIHDVTNDYDTAGLMSKYLCKPTGVQSPQLQKVVIKRLNEKPEDLHLTTAGEVALILYEVFPCD